MMMRLLSARYSTGFLNFILVVKVVCFVLIALGAIALIVTVMMQAQSSGGGTNVISGVNESYYAKNRGKSLEGKLKLITTISAIVISVASIILILLISKI